ASEQLVGWLLGLERVPEGRGDAVDQQILDLTWPVGGGAGERRECGAIRKALTVALKRRQREPRLAAAARSEQRHQPRAARAQQVAELRQLGLAANEAGQRRWGSRQSRTARRWDALSRSGRWRWRGVRRLTQPGVERLRRGIRFHAEFGLEHLPATFVLGQCQAALAKRGVDLDQPPMCLFAPWCDFQAAEQHRPGFRQLTVFDELPGQPQAQ